MDKRLTADLNVVSNSNLEIQLLDGDLNIIQKLDDEPNDVGGLTSAELKAKFDESGNIIKKYINETLIPAVLTDDATEESRKQAEAARVAAEQGRVTAEEGRVSAESGRVSAEQARANAEASRVSAEQARANAEASRVSAEQARANAEASRVSAESARVQAETARADETAGIVARATAQANAAVGSASQAQASAAAAAQSAAAAAQSAASVDGINKTAQSWAVGGTGTRPGEDTDNAKYWAKQAQTAVAGSVRYDAAQSLSDAQKAQARGNINAAPGGFGLGGDSKMLTPSDNLDTLMQNGWFQYDKNNPPKGTLPTALEPYASLIRVSVSGLTCVQEAFDPSDSDSHGVVLRRTVYGVGAGAKIYPWEYENPPMELGTEYRTTERYLGKSVYVKVVDCGQIADGKEVAHGIDNMLYCIFAQGLRAGMPMPIIYNHNLSDPWSCYIAAVNNTKITFACGTSAAGGNCFVTFKYVKTTD